MIQKNIPDDTVPLNGLPLELDNKIKVGFVFIPNALVRLCEKYSSNIFEHAIACLCNYNLGCFGYALIRLIRK